MRRTAQSRSERKGTILPLVTVALGVLCGFTALAVDIGLMAVAKNQLQNAADSASLTAARTLTGGSSPNLAGATANGVTAAQNSPIVGSQIATGDVVINLGNFYYNESDQTFHWSTTNPSVYNLAQATVTHAPSSAFAKVFNYQAFNLSATSVSAHRPRDVSIILDFSGSMNNESDFWNCESYLGNMINTPNNADTLVPTFGQYCDTSGVNLIQTGTDPRVGKCNITQPVLGVPALVNDYFQMARGQPTVYAFNATPSSWANTPLGDPWFKNPSGNYGNGYPWAGSTYDLGSSYSGVNFGQQTGGSVGGYMQYYGYTDVANAGVVSYAPSIPTGWSTKLSSASNKFMGFQVGPGYWGASFFMWPPDPSLLPTASTDPRYIAANPSPPNTSYQAPWRFDWRQRFFMNTDYTRSDFPNNTSLWNGSGQWNNPSGNYIIDYYEILQWIKQVNSAVYAQTGNYLFPPQLRAGYILYYSSIPDDVPASAYNHTQLNSKITNPDQRFWKEYIDFVLGVWRDPFGNIQTPGNPSCSYGEDFNFAGTGINATPTQSSTSLFMSAYDKPLYPRNRFWFGPITMIQYIADTGLNPGTVHDISMYPAKLGIQGALQDIQLNHPNDLVSMILFNRPQYNNDPSGIGMFNFAQSNFGTNYSQMETNLWYPPNSGSSDVRPWDSNGVQTPRAYGDFCANTATQYGFMLAYNQFSSSSTLRSQSVGGLGRNGAQRMVIFETDGMANQDSVPSPTFFTNLGANSSYYNILSGQVVNGAGYSSTHLYQAVMSICNTSTGTATGNYGANTPVVLPANPGYPGFGTTSKPVTIDTIAFGVVFEPTAVGSTQTSAVQVVQTVASIGGTVFPTSSTDPTNGYKWCIGTLAQRQAKLQTAFNTFMDNGVTITLMNPDAYTTP